MTTSQRLRSDSRPALLVFCLALGTVLVSFGGCWPDRLEGKACDYVHPCFDGYRCTDGVCLVDDGQVKVYPDDAMVDGPNGDAGSAIDLDAGSADGGFTDRGDAGEA